jgi:hypothetical protein
VGPLSTLQPTGTPEQDEAGAAVLALALRSARALWGERLIAAYAIGSLAHGGFSPHVSDVDIALVLKDPLHDHDAGNVQRICEQVGASREPLADRLSIFWGSTATLSGRGTGGRFPPVDVLDLREHGRLLEGEDVRSAALAPRPRDLVVSGAEFAYRILSGPESMAYLQGPEKLAAAPVRTLTKLSLYPIRFMYTARTGKVGINDEAVAHFLATTRGPAADLARRALSWRYNPPLPGAREVAEVLRHGVPALYRLFIEDYEARLREYGEPDLARTYRDWSGSFWREAAR